MASFAGGHYTGIGRALGDGVGNPGTVAFVAVVVGEGTSTSCDHCRGTKTPWATKFQSSTSKMHSMMSLSSSTLLRIRVIRGSGPCRASPGQQSAYVEHQCERTGAAWVCCTQGPQWMSKKPTPMPNQIQSSGNRTKMSASGSRVGR